MDDFVFGISSILYTNSIDRFVSLFALFLLILHRIKNTIGCKSETKRCRKLTIGKWGNICVMVMWKDCYFYLYVEKGTEQS